jgi:Lipid A 3-O-deacylase (PagL)
MAHLPPSLQALLWPRLRLLHGARVAVLLALALLPATGAQGNGASYFGGRGNGEFRVQRGAFQWEGPLDGLVGTLGIAASYLELSAARWRSVVVDASDFTPRRGYREIRVLAIAPVLRWTLGAGPAGTTLYGEYGLGLAHLSGVEIEDENGEQRHVGSRWPFEHRLSIGLRTVPSGPDFNLRFMHLSNGKLASHNDGIDILGVTLGYWF